MINYLYNFFRILFYPIIILANFLQNNLTTFFTPMNMGPVAENSYLFFIKKNIDKKEFVLDFGSGAGFFSKLFDPKKYLGTEININFVKVAKKKNKQYKFKILKKDYLRGYKKKISLVFINNVLHHLTDNQVKQTFKYFKNNLNKKTKLLIIEPLFPKTFFSLEFFLKVLDIGNNIKDKKNYTKLLSKIIKIKSLKVMKVGIGKVLVVKGNLEN